MARAEVITRVQSEHVPRQLPRRTARPLVTVAPARVKHFQPRRATVAQGPTPAATVLVEDELQLPALDQFGHDKVAEVRRDQPRVADARVAQTRRGRVVGEARQHVLLDRRHALLFPLPWKEPESEAQRRAMIADPRPDIAARSELGLEIAPDEPRHVVRKPR